MWLYAYYRHSLISEISVSAISDLTQLMILSPFSIFRGHVLIFMCFFEPEIAIKNQRHSFLSQCSLKAH